MKLREYFPLGMAAGLAFCNRTEEADILLNNLQNGKHTLLMAARRYGKSSLAHHALEKSRLPFVEVDFYMARNEKIIETYILDAVIKLIGKAIGPVDKLTALIKKFVKHLRPKLMLETNHVSLELAVSAVSDPATNIKEALMLLEHLLEHRKQTAVLLFDEFQNVGVISQGCGIEAAIRHVAQKTKRLAFIFSGSNRKLLKTMFEDDTRPLYKLCWKLALSRIAQEHYVEHINKASKKAWKIQLSDDVIKQILFLTERHPYYVNKLCDYLWTVYQKPPTKKMVNQCWLKVLEEEKSDAVKEISLLSMGQKAVLLQIAAKGAEGLTSQNTLMEMSMSSSSVISALSALDEKDVIERFDDGSIQIINPVVKHYVLQGANLL